MTNLLMLIPIALLLGGLGLAGFLWALRSGQFDDLDGASYRILFDDDQPRRPAVVPHPVADAAESPAAKAADPVPVSPAPVSPAPVSPAPVSNDPKRS